MALYEISDIQQKNLLAIISQANIKGGDAPAIMELAKALQQPIKKDEPKEEVKPE